VNRDDLRKENKQDMASRQRSRRFVVARNRCVVREEEEGWKKRLKVVAENSSLDHISVHVTHLAEVGAEADQEIIEREALSSPYHLIHPLANQNIMADRRRTNAPAGGTSAPLFVSNTEATSSQRPTRQRSASTPRKIFLQTGLVPSASGSAYLELHLHGSRSATITAHRRFQPESTSQHTRQVCAIRESPEKRLSS
jgi:hypothetical protein